MIVDLAEHTRLPLEQCDVCVLGAGPAGIVTALELARARPDWQIVLAEGGGFSPPGEDGLDSYQAQETDNDSYPLAATRLRYLGGSSNHWGGWVRPLDPEVFLARPQLPLSGWPFTRETLDSAYRRAAHWCEVDSDDYDADRHLAGGEGLLDLADSELLCHHLFRFSPPTRFGERYRDELETTANLSCWLHANALGLELADQQVGAVRLGHHGGLRASLRARQVVVAMGGVENARLLLLHRNDSPDNGLGSPMLGRCFADHAGFAPAQALLPARLDYGRRGSDSGPIMPVLGIRPEAQRALDLSNASLIPLPVQASDSLDNAYGDNSLFGFRPGSYWRYRLQMVIEPQANPDSRLLLGEETDRLGMPRLRVDWRLHEHDRERGSRSLRLLARGLGRIGLGRLRPLAEPDAFQRNPTFVSHHMGSTRMSSSPDDGVVDGHGRVHGIENLHVAGSSVFPAYGFSNPTLTILALAVRLAARLAGNDSGDPG